VAGRPLALVAALASACALAGGAGGAPGAARWFHSPTGNIECELNVGRGLPTYAACQTFRPPQIATLHPNGRTAVCARPTCPLGNGPENATVLRYGRSARLGPFRCDSRVTGMRCVVRATGHGFSIARRGVRTF
jgi:hypothetical protein